MNKDFDKFLEQVGRIESAIEVFSWHDGCILEHGADWNSLELPDLYDFGKYEVDFDDIEKARELVGRIRAFELVKRYVHSPLKFDPDKLRGHSVYKLLGAHNWAWWAWNIIKDIDYEQGSYGIFE